MTSPRCTLKPSAPYTVPNVLPSHRAICPQVWFCAGSLGFQFGQSSPQASSTVGRHKARDPRNTAIILRVQAYGKRMPNTVSQSKITAENSFGRNIHSHSRAYLRTAVAALATHPPEACIKNIMLCSWVVTGEACLTSIYAYKI